MTQVYIAPLGGEDERIYKPAIASDDDIESPFGRFGPDKAVLLDFLGQEKTPAHVELHDSVKEALEEAGIEWEAPQVDMSELQPAVSTFVEYIRENAFADKIVVNLTTGSTICAIAGMIACMSTGLARPIYVQAETHTSVAPQPAEFVTDIEDIPNYHIDRPDNQLLRIMDYIDNSEQTIELGKADDPTEESEAKPYRNRTELAEFGRERRLPFWTQHGRAPEEYKNDASRQKASFGLLKDHVIGELKDSNMIEERKRGKETLITLTTTGENTLEAFRDIIRGVDDRELGVMRLIHRQDTETTPQELAEKLGDDGTDDHDGENDPVTRLREQVLAPLADRGLVVIEGNSGGFEIVSLTEAGKEELERLDYVAL